MAAVATVGITVLDGVGWGDEIKRVIAGLAGDGILAGLRHVAFDASAADARWSVVSVFGDDLVIEPGHLTRRVACEAQRVGVGGLEGHRTVP